MGTRRLAERHRVALSTRPHAGCRGSGSTSSRFPLLFPSLLSFILPLTLSQLACNSLVFAASATPLRFLPTAFSSCMWRFSSCAPASLRTCGVCLESLDALSMTWCWRRRHMQESCGEPGAPVEKPLGRLGDALITMMDSQMITLF